MIFFIIGCVLILSLFLLALLKKDIALKSYYEWLELTFAILFLSSLNLFYFSSGTLRGDDDLLPQIAYVMFLTSILIFFILIIIRVLKLIFK